MKIAIFLVLISVTYVFSYPSVATWYCSLSNSGEYGSCFPGSCGTYSSINGHGIASQNPQLYGGASTCHYQGSSCGQCWQLSGPGGTATVAITDCCAGYPGNPSCETDPSDNTCDWCADNNHWHFDLDRDSFVQVCGQSGLNAGHCNLSNTVQVGC